jgi:hypothetical protein
LVSYLTVKKYFWRTIQLCLFLLLLCYVSDTLLFKYRAAHSQPGRPFDSVTAYVAAPMKNGSVQLFYGHPQQFACIRAIFPHAGYSPCWYVSETPVKMI